LGPAGIWAFAALAAVCIYVMWPRTWKFSISAAGLLDKHVYGTDGSPVSDEDEMIESMAAELQGYWGENEEVRNRLGIGIALGCVALALEVVPWLWVIGR
jgi:hypothetical protein